jgi:hypothetical protein
MSQPWAESGSPASASKALAPLPAGDTWRRRPIERESRISSNGALNLAVNRSLCRLQDASVRVADGALILPWKGYFYHRHI